MNEQLLQLSMSILDCEVRIIPNTSGRYAASINGDILSLYYHTGLGEGWRKAPRILKPQRVGGPKSGAFRYHAIAIFKKLHYVHRLMALTYLPNPTNAPTVGHMNSEHTDNRLVNLRWETYTEQQNNPITRARYKSTWKDKADKKNLGNWE